MQPDIDQRIKRVLDRHRQRRLSEIATEDALRRERRLAREHVLAEIPQMLTHLSNAVAELNDGIAEDGIHLDFRPPEPAYTLEASYMVAMTIDGHETLSVAVNVAATGRVAVILRSGEARALLASCGVWEADKTFFLDVLLSLLEEGVR